MFRRELFKRVTGVVTGGYLSKNTEIYYYERPYKETIISATLKEFKHPTKFEEYLSFLLEKQPKENEFVNITYVSMDKEI